MRHENEPERLPVCNFCEKEYDPYDTHTCPGNQILPSRRNDDLAKAAAMHGPICAYPEFAKNATAEALRASPEAVDAFIAAGKAAFPTALDQQQGGDHYRNLPIQPVEYIIANGIGFLAGNIIKYATRYKDKGGAEDIRKIKHYCDLILEFEYKEKS